MTAARKLDHDTEMLDRELEDLPAELRWREWMNRIEAVIFASSKPVEREALLLVVGKSASIDLLIEDIQADLKAKPYEIVPVSGGWMFRTAYSGVIRPPIPI